MHLLYGVRSTLYVQYRDRRDIDLLYTLWNVSPSWQMARDRSVFCDDTRTVLCIEP